MYKIWAESSGGQARRFAQVVLSRAESQAICWRIVGGALFMNSKRSHLSTVLAAIAGAAVLLAAGCASAPESGLGSAPVAEASGVSAPCPGQTSEALWSGSRLWQDGEGGPWTMTFKATGMVVYSYGGTTYDNGRWSQAGAKLTFDFNDHYADYEGTVAGDKVAGTMKNVNGDTGEWSAQRSCG